MVAVVAVQVAVKNTTATTKNAHSIMLFKLLVAVVAVISTSKQNLKKFVKRYNRIKRLLCVSINSPYAATSATNLLKVLDIPSFSTVAVPKNSATSSATAATKNLNI